MASRTTRKLRESPPTDTKDPKKKKKDELKFAHAQSKKEEPPAKSSDWEKCSKSCNSLLVRTAYIPPDAIRSLRRAYGGTQTASLTVPAVVAKKVLGYRGEILVGWVNCRIRTVERLVKYYKCWHYGHLAIKRKSGVNRAKLCTKCREADHKAAACEKEAHCALCAEKDQTKYCAHIAGSNRYPIFREALQKTVRELKIDLLMISEALRHLSTQPWETDKSRKAIIWSCGKFRFQSVANTEEAGFVVVKLEGIHFYSCYAPPSLTFDEFLDFLYKLTEDAKQHFPVAIAGDFNAWAVDWASKETKARGQTLLEAMSSLDVVLLNNGDKPTFVRGEKSSIVDLTFVSSNLVRGNCSCEKTNDIGWKVSTFDLSSFLVALDDHSISGRSATEKAEYLMRRVGGACDTSMPRKRTGSRLSLVHWWNDQIAALREKCVKARRSSQHGWKKPNSEELEIKYKDARRELNKAIKDRPYKVVMTRLKSQPMPSPTCPELLKKILTASFPQQSELHQSAEHSVEPSIPPFTEEQLKEACGRVGNTNAPGLDGIPNIALKAAINAVPGLLLDVYNAYLEEGTFPAKWKQQRLVLLPKGKKPLDEPSSYRPLCMLDTAENILERIIHRRIEAAVEPLLADNQYGFRTGRSTLNAIDLVVNTAKEAISGTRWREGTKKYCLVATLDIKNAFNSVKWDCIMKALETMNVPGYLRRMVASYFTNRILKYDTESGPKEYQVTGGVPQGPVLDPLLWYIIYDGLLKLQESRRKTAPVCRLSALRVADAYCTVSADAVCVIAGMLPIEVLAEERRRLYWRKGQATMNPEELEIEETKQHTPMAVALK
ncbi:uncharacterized protein LOC107045635 [Diachasma alloeum]|uniref:uncharacterized protein LOC107045635 n=1 Tax=Diachasma alloeum TaxID=454923 RepID=UPI000738121B|nr:uncharacterized protein LOC107045635 [Diachasma alloeum]